MSVYTFFSKIIMVIRNHHWGLGCMHCVLHAELWPGPRSRLEDVLWPSTAGCPSCLGRWFAAPAFPEPPPLHLLVGQGLSPGGSVGILGHSEPSLLLWAMSLVISCGKGFSISFMPWGPFPGSGCSCSPVARSCILAAQAWVTAVLYKPSTL